MIKIRKHKKRRDKISIFRESVLSDLSNLDNHMLRVKYYLSLRQKEEILKSISSNSFPGKQYIYKGIIAKTINDISSTKFIPFFEKQDIVLDIEWILLILKKYKKELQDYIILKDKYETSLINGKIEEAYLILNKINTEITYSFWGIEQTMVCSEMLGGFENNRNKLSEIAEETNKYLILMFSEFYSYKAEIDSTYNNFIHRMENFFSQNPDKFDEILIKDYLEFQFKTFDTNQNEESLRRVLSLSMTLPLIDLYENFIKASSIILSTNTYSTEVKNLIKNSIDDMQLNDNRLHNMQILNAPLKLTIKDINLDDSKLIAKIIESYTVGNYNQCLNLINLNQNLFVNFDILDIYVKSLLNSGIEIKKINNINEFLKNKVITPIYNIYSCINKEENLNKLIDSSKILGNISYRFKIESFYLLQISPINESRSRLYHNISDINSKLITPRFVLSLENTDEKLSFLKTINSDNYFMYTTKLMESYVRGNFDNENLTNIPLERYNYYKGKAQTKEDLIKAFKEIAHNVNVLQKSKARNYKMFEYERIANELFKTYLENSNLEEAVNIIVDSYLMNRSTVIRMDKEKLKEMLDLEEYQMSNIKRIIFEYIVDDKDYYNIYTTLINFLEDNQLTIPSELLVWSKSNTANIKEVQFILSHLYTKEIMKYFVRINPKQRNEERIKVLNSLIEMDNNTINQQKYNEEINNIMKSQSIQERIKSIDEKKIFVDTEAILNEFDSLFKEKYRRYVALKELKQELSFFDLNEATSKIEKFSQAARLEFSESQEKKQRFLMYKEIIQELSNEILHNPKYGLAKFLSSRIRHGLLENNLSKSFKHFNLLSLKVDSEDKEFLINKYWDEEFNKYKNDLSEDDKAKIKIALGTFSKKIVNKIEEVKEWIRINDKNHKDGMFNYSALYKENSLLIFYGSSSKNLDYKTFFDEIINYFWSVTEENLKVIRERINNELFDYYMTCLDNLMLEVEKINNSSNELISILSNNINLCKTVVKNDLKQISNWFVVRRHGEYYDFSVQELISTCVEINRKTNKNYSLINSSENIETSIHLKGKTFYYLVDIITMLYSNAIEHSGFESFEDMSIKIEISELEGLEVAKIADYYEKDETFNKNDLDFVKQFRESKVSTLKIKVKNLLSEQKDLEKIYDRVNEILGKIKNLDKYTNLVSEEGGTGISKIYYTLKHNVDSVFIHQYYIDDNKWFNAEIYLSLDGLISTEEVKDESSIY